ncbi:MAG: BamA/TamA family outer membrane protein [Ignavibacteriaceae bacterium]
MRLLFFSFILMLAVFNTKAQQPELYELTKIEFNGNKSISTSELQSIIFSEETPWWFYKFLNSFTGFGKEPVYFDSSSIEIDLQALRAYYHANGFFKAKFNYSYSVDTTDKEVVLSYNISENGQAKIGQINYIGLEKVPEHIIFRIHAERLIDSTLFYQQDRIEQSIAHTMEILLNRGYMFTQHDSTVIYIDTVSNRANLDIYFQTGERYQVSEIRVEKKGDGAPYVSEELLIELTDIKKEEYYNKEKIRNSQTRLVRTGLFNSLLLDADKKDTSGNQVPLKIQGSIGKMNEFLPGIAMNSEKNVFNLGVNASYSRKNFLGNARKLTLTTEIAAQDIQNFNFSKFFSRQNYSIDGYASVNLKLEQPYLFQKPIFGTLENYFLVSTRGRENEKIYGTKASFEFEMPAYTFINQLRPYLNLEFYDDKAINQYDEDSIIYVPEYNQFNTTSFIGLQLGSAKANSFFYPTSGYNLLITYEAAVSNVQFNMGGIVLFDSSGFDFHLKETALFYRTEIASSFYFPLSKDRQDVFAAKVKTGYVQTFKGGALLIPGNRTFFAGGSNSVRGWRSKELYPQINEDSLTIASLLTDLQGGTFLLEGSLEYRKRFLESLGAVFFIDYGNVWNGYGQFRFDEVALAVGIGFRYYSQIAPFRIDFGFKLYDPKDKSFIWNRPFFKNYEWHFGIGEAF